jgi:hypothetical protein
MSRALAFLSIALFALVSARLIAHDSRFAVIVVLAAAAFVVPVLLARRRMRRLLLSGDIVRVLGVWQGRKVNHPETMTPLVTATAYAAYGFIEQARNALSRAAKGPAWEAAVEQRLFVETLLDTYEGERSLAITKAEELEKLPLPDVGFWMRRKISLLRRGIAALARAFAHASRTEDEEILRNVARSSPLVHWAMRYARVIFLVDAGRMSEARLLLHDAPVWPADSAFRSFHDELVTQLGYGSSGTSSSVPA